MPLNGKVRKRGTRLPNNPRKRGRGPLSWTRTESLLSDDMQAWGAAEPEPDAGKKEEAKGKKKDLAAFRVRVG